MPTGNEGTAAPEGSSATPLEADLAEMFGDFTTSAGESPEPDTTSAAGTTLAEPATGTEKKPDEATVPAATEKPSEETTSAAASVVDEDPLSATTPATYVVNGQTRTSDDIRVFKEGGAVIVAEALPNVLSKLAEREQLAERVRVRDTEYQTLAKATEWTDSQGKAFTGAQAAVEMQVSNAGLLAENSLVVEGLQSLLQHEDLEALLTTKKVEDGNGGLRDVVVFKANVREEIFRDLKRENAMRFREINATTRDHYKTVLAQASQPAAAPIDFATEAPHLIAQIAEESKLDASVLTPQDRALLAKQMSRHLERDRAGKPLVSLDWQELVRERLQDRANQKAASTTLVSTTTDATKKAQANMAAAARGVKPTTKPAATVPPKAPSPQVERMADEGELFDAMLSSGAKAMRAG